ncbi:transmembrane protein-like [Tropilaelaps mercedesae]|uniref:Transmembrane protein 186 n=1 Tax=Tropilaelaps mercedesae TaxID=418985 RepID=A0A1V9XJH9_9ACAR|nr:transmembrane protein-like [Tropilaelaps mercedesae]
MLLTARAVRFLGGELRRGFAGLAHCRLPLSLNLTQCRIVTVNRRLLCHKASSSNDNQPKNTTANGPRFHGGIESYVEPAGPVPATLVDNLPVSVPEDAQSLQAKDPIEAENWTCVYRFPHIVKVTILLRVKLYQTAMTLLLTPCAYWACICGYITEGNMVIATLSSIFTSSTLLWAGFIGERLLGAVYQNDTAEKVRLAHLTFWGRRKDVVVDESDIASLTDVGEKMENIYVRIALYSRPKDPLYLFPALGGIQDAEAFERIFNVKARQPVFKVTKIK